MSSKALYPGSFDPFTNGHRSLVERLLLVFDNLTVAVAHNVRKNTLFTVEERIEMIRQTFKGDQRITIDSFSGLTMDYAQKIGAKIIVRGLRAVADFEYELQMANMNKKLRPNIETLFIMAAEEHFFVSSRAVKELAALGGPIEHLVPAHVAVALRERMEPH